MHDPRSRRAQMEQIVYPSDPYTFIKHRAYAHYLNCWLPVFLQTRETATVVDAFAGSGIYTGGDPGSSVIVARTFLEHSRLSRFKGRLRLMSLEEREDRTLELNRQMERLARNPRLSWKVLPAGSLIDKATVIQKETHRTNTGDPVLWLLDPYGPASLPATLVQQCVESGPRDEAIVSFFCKEMHQRKTVSTWQTAMERHFGSDSWRSVLDCPSQSEGMRRLVEAYCKDWRSRGLFSSYFAVRVPSEGARYFLVFLTHAERGLDCWTKMQRRMDPLLGEGASPNTIDAPTLFDDLTFTPRIIEILQTYVGQEKAWRDMRIDALQAGQSDKVLRAGLTQLQEKGLAFRVTPLDSRTPWPDGCTVRFYAEEDLRKAEELRII